MMTDSAVVWTPRPPAEDEPACWSWEVPYLMTRDELKAAQAILNASLPPDERRDLRAFDYHQPEGVRFNVFHDDWCALCGGKRSGSVPDHDHETGQVRGWLCRSCNVWEGKSDHLVVRRYRAWHPAAILDYHQMYDDGNWWHKGWSVMEVGPGVYQRERRPVTPWPAWDPKLLDGIG